MVLKFTCEYHGKYFCGFQRQQSHTSHDKHTQQKPSVQQCLEDALSKFFNQKITISASGRTDAGVHAKGQVCSFITPEGYARQLHPTSNKENCPNHPPKYSQPHRAQEHARTESHQPEHNPSDMLFKLATALNAFLPEQVSVREFEIMPDTFNARHSVKSKTYTYKCYYAKHRSPLNDDFHNRLYIMPNIEHMIACIPHFLNTHDFTAFCSTKTDKENKVRTINHLDIATHDNKITFTITGNGFLRNMVRIIVGTLLDVGYGKITPEQIPEIIASKNRTLAGNTAPPHGLCLEHVEY